MPSCGSRGLRFRERFKRAGIDFGCGWAYALRQLKKEPRGFSMAAKKIEKCAHPGCNCPAVPGSKYCGAYCEGSANRPSIACNCRHAECGAGELASTAG